MLKLAIDIAEGEYKDFYLNQYLQNEDEIKNKQNGEVHIISLQKVIAWDVLKVCY